MEKDNKVVYLHRRDDNNNIFYVGMGVSSRPYDKRGRNKHWNRVVNKAGYRVDIVADGLTKDAACELEMFIISLIGLDDLTNHTAGGEGNNYWKGKKRPDIAERLRLANTGRTVSQETRDKLSRAHTGRKHTQEAIEKMKGKTYTQEAKDKMSLNSPKSKRVIDKSTGIIYKSCAFMCKELNLTYGTIQQRINPNNKLHINNTNYEYYD